MKRSGLVEEVTIPAHPHHVTGDMLPERTGPAICCGSAFGMGAITYRDEDALAVLAKIDAALLHL